MPSAAWMDNLMASGRPLESREPKGIERVRESSPEPDVPTTRSTCPARAIRLKLDILICKPSKGSLGRVGPRPRISDLGRKNKAGSILRS